ncbi:hypothetical protein AGABI1DRAFT_105053 [Agaricus bisporus var. burnettii JB137-S8]|uniref:Uncharacterized protein n=1 Tax=Agaricus bisporus var. burnettii (strain JB137-S8 / ATCC MYA-4627 / FGSC 10392) TaxID=597362 RepID=K5X0Z4_AGABU|nr:hypothetical protein AGABI2DRAFT_178680 [Agaricus bisporus var. bisporus H97]XP_007327390.1 uncharacterized protein AGABI1DRAFT_105053 [Agaricus bisporus var. burnettii JB137-S8]EKM81476.1 hypothetical protein AGABI1DRAFT_105053 [Agaricus bisporus var. burnettii JB137-S8]EKV46254.1 hypothetical protein AGABI2DRAFT_178680 [Agaricus bisporus var. bisporus H97]
MSRYHNSIHSPIFPSQVSSYSSLSGALAPPPSQFTSSRRRRVPQSTCKTSSGPICGPIGFDYIGQAGQGVSLADFSARSQNAICQMVTDANDQALSGMAISKINLRIMWTGYEHLNFVQSMPVSPNMSKGQLGASIAMQFWSFVDLAQKSTTTNPQWQINQTRIPFERIFLVALYSIGDDVWQADVAVDF